MEKVASVALQIDREAGKRVKQSYSRSQMAVRLLVLRACRTRFTPGIIMVLAYV
jgi:hypothetical protein